MIGAFVLLAIGLLMLSAMQARETMRWQHSLHAYRLSLPRDLSVVDVAQWLGTVAAMTHPPRWSLFLLPPVVFEVVATERGITHYVLVATGMRSALLAGVRATLPGARLEEDLTYHHRVLDRLTIATEYTLSNRTLPLAAERAETVSASLTAALQPLGRGERIVLQLVVTSAGTSAALPKLHSTHATESDTLKERRSQRRDPLLAATLRIGVAAATSKRASVLLSRAGGMLQGLNTSGARLVPRLIPPFVTRERLATRSYPLFEWPLLLTVSEAPGLIAVPFHTSLPGMPVGQARQLPPTPTLPTSGAIVGRSNYPGVKQRALALATNDRLGHVHLIGPTGAGKSTLLAQLALQDITRGHGVVVIDPKGDLVRDIAARIPEKRIADVIVLDPSAVQTDVIGFNPLRVPSGTDANDNAARELIADRVLGIFHALYYDFWGPRTDEILRAALFSLAYTTAPDGSPFTLIETPELLTNPSFRRFVCEQPALPPYLRAFWQWFDGSLRPADRVEATAPVLNKVRAFAMRGNLRLLLGQSQGIDLYEHLRARRVLLVSLAKGTLGSEAASLLGALFVAALWQAAQARITLPPDERHPLFAYLDEFQDVVRLGADESLADMLAQARGLGLSLTLAHQYLSQLPSAVRAATLGTVRTHIAFQLAWDDAQSLAARFAPLVTDDLTGLQPFEFALQAFVAGQTLPPVTGVTLPLGAPIQDAAALAHASRARYGVPRGAIERGLQARLSAIVGGPASRRYGRAATKPTGGQS